MKNEIHVVHGAVDGIRVPDIALYRLYDVPFRVGKRRDVEGTHGVSPRQQVAHEVDPHEARTPGDQTARVAHVADPEVTSTIPSRSRTMPDHCVKLRLSPSHKADISTTTRRLPAAMTG